MLKLLKSQIFLGIKTEMLVCKINKLSQIKDINEFFQVKLIEMCLLNELKVSSYIHYF